MSIKHLFTLLLIAGAPLFAQTEEQEEEKEQVTPAEIFAADQQDGEEIKKIEEQTEEFLSCACGCGCDILSDEEKKETEEVVG